MTARRRTHAERTLDAEVRAVEEGHHARLHSDRGRRFLVASDTVAGRNYSVSIRMSIDGQVLFECDHPVYVYAERELPSPVPCKHGALCARRLEREGLLQWVEGAWRGTDAALAAAREQAEASVPDDPFDGLPGC